MKDLQDMKAYLLAGLDLDDELCDRVIISSPPSCSLGPKLGRLRSSKSILKRRAQGYLKTEQGVQKTLPRSRDGIPKSTANTDTTANLHSFCF